jgi:hypothetical protein
MPKLIKTLTHPDSPERLTQLLFSWRLWLAGALLGALLGWAAYALFPPDYRAQAVVIFDQNLEEAWKWFPERELFQFAGREALKLEALAFSDEVLSAVSAETGLPVETLRDEKLELAYPIDGVWYFYGRDADPARAEQIASAWVTAFVKVTQESIVIDQEMEALRAELNAIYTENPDTDPLELDDLLEEVRLLYEDNTGINPYLEIGLLNEEELEISFVVEPGLYILGGSLLGVLAAGFAGLFYIKPEEQDV